MTLDMRHPLTLHLGTLHLGTTHLDATHQDTRQIITGLMMLVNHQLTT